MLPILIVAVQKNTSPISMYDFLLPVYWLLSIQPCNKIYQEFTKNGDGNYCREWFVKNWWWQLLWRVVRGDTNHGAGITNYNTSTTMQIIFG